MSMMTFDLSVSNTDRWGYIEFIDTFLDPNNANWDDPFDNAISLITLTP